MSDGSFMMMMMMEMPMPMPVMPAQVPVNSRMFLVNLNHSYLFGPTGFNRSREGINQERQQQDCEQFLHEFRVP